MFSGHSVTVLQLIQMLRNKIFNPELVARDNFEFGARWINHGGGGLQGVGRIWLYYKEVKIRSESEILRVIRECSESVIYASISSRSNSRLDVRFDKDAQTCRAPVSMILFNGC